MIRRTSSGRPITATTDENNELVEELICSQEDFLGTQQATREIARNVGITRSSVRRLVKRRKINQFKRMTTLHMNNGTRDWRRIRSGNFAERFDRNPRLVEKFAYQDEKDFTLEVPTNIQNNRVYFKGKKDQVPDENLFHQTNKQFIKVIVSACLTWNGATKPFFVNGYEVKINAKTYKQHLQINIKNWIFGQDNTSSHRPNPIQDFLQETLNSSFIKPHEWPPSSPIVIPSIIVFGIKGNEKYMKIDLTSRLKTR